METTTEVKEMPVVFDPSKFRDHSETKTEETTSVVTETGTPVNTGTIEKPEENTFTWEEPEENTTTTVNTNEEKLLLTEQPLAEITNVPAIETNKQPINFDYKAVAKSSGLGEDIDDESKFNARVQEIVKENERLRSLETSNESAQLINSLESVAKLDDEPLVRKDLKASGMSDEKIEEWIDDAKANNTLKKDAMTVRNHIDQAIAVEKQTLSKAKEATQQMQAKQKEQAEAQKANDERQLKQVREVMDKTEQMFGFAITDKPEKLKQVRDSHFDYVTTGKFHEEIVSSPENLIEVSWLWKNRGILKKALINKGVNLGKKEVLDKMGNPTTESPTRIHVAEAAKKGEVDIKAWSKRE